MNRSTLADPMGTVHAVTIPIIPATYPAGGSVTVRALCGVGSDMPASLARRAHHPAFAGRAVTCSGCLATTGQSS